MSQPFKSVAPIIGAPIVFEWRPVVTFQCSCGKGRPMLISAADAAAVCNGCDQTYVLGQLHFDRSKGFGAGIELRRIAAVRES